MTQRISSQQRDLRIDFFRGLSLLLIVANHIDLFSQKFYFKFSLKWLQPGFSDAAEIFVFLSGYVYGIVYFKYLNNNDFGKLYFKSFYRFVQLYFVNIFTLFIILAIYGLFKTYIDPNLIAAGGVAHFFQNPHSSSIFAILMIYAPALINVLPLYMLLLLVMPFYLKLMKKKMWLALAISFVIYLLPHFFSWLNLPAYPFASGEKYPWSRGWAFNPFVWQFLFLLGMIISISLKYKDLKIPRNRILITLAIIILALSTIPRITFILQKFGMMNTNWIGKIPFTAKKTLAPFRLIHFFSLAYLISIIFPVDHRLFKNKFAKPIIKCGQHSLEVFSFGIILTYTSYYLLIILGISEFKYYLLTIISWIFMLYWGQYLAWKKKI